MVQEADQYRAEDEAQKDKVTAKNTLESLAFNMKSTVEDDKLKDKISADDKKVITDKCNDVIAWLDRNQVGDKNLKNMHYILIYMLKTSFVSYEFFIEGSLKQSDVPTLKSICVYTQNVSPNNTNIINS